MSKINKKQKRELKKQLRKLQKTFNNINNILTDTQYNVYKEVKDEFDNKYPFDKSFDKLTIDVNNWVSNICNSIKIIKGTAIYTGGGIYIIVGKLNDGNYVNTDGCFWDVYNDNAMDKVDTSIYEEICDDMCNYEHPQWCNEHRISEHYRKKDILRAIKKFCKDLDNGKGDEYLIDEFKKTDNYMSGELMIYVYEHLKKCFNE